jgi:hypothetical protein
VAAAIEREFGTKPRLVEGHGGVFDVVADGTTIYSNEGRCGPLPRPDEILRKLGYGPNFRSPP